MPEKARFLKLNLQHLLRAASLVSLLLLALVRLKWAWTTTCSPPLFLALNQTLLLAVDDDNNHNSKLYFSTMQLGATDTVRGDNTQSKLTGARAFEQTFGSLVLSWNWLAVCVWFARRWRIERKMSLLLLTCYDEQSLSYSHVVEAINKSRSLWTS